MTLTTALTSPPGAQDPGAGATPAAPPPGRRTGSDPLQLRVVDVLQAAPDVRTVVLAALDGSRLPSFTPGSHLVLTCGQRRNAYSLTGPTIEPATYSISVLHHRTGRGGSAWVHAQLHPGAVVTASVPRSAFAPVLTARHHLLVAGGIGITAMLSHVRAALQWNRSFTLLYSYRPGHGAHVQELRRLCEQRLQEVHGRAATRRHLQEALAGQPLGTHVYTCGPSALIDTVQQCALAAGWPAERVHAERFAVDELPPGRPFTARLTSSGRAIDVPSGTSLLEALEAGGVAVPNRCRQGVCGECRLTVRSGRIEHRDLYLSAEERAANDSIMACVSRSADESVEIDL